MTDLSSSSSSTTMIPRILAQASLPAVCRFSSSNEESPELSITLTLQAAQSAILLHKHISPFFPLMNAIRIRDAQTLEIVQTPRMDVCRRRSYASDTNREKYWTLEPNMPFLMMKLNFRPYGGLILKNFTREQLHTLGSERWKIYVTLGMHILEPGKEYLIDIHEGLYVYNWELVTNRDDNSEKADADGVFAGNLHDAAKKPRLPVDVAEAVRFRVED